MSARRIYLCAAMSILLAGPAMSQVTTISLPPAALAKVGGNSIFYYEPRDPKYVITALSDEGIRRIHSLQAVAQKLPSMQLSIYAIYSDAGGILYVCYTAPLAGPRGPTTTVVARIDEAADAVVEIWKDSELLPRSIAVAPSGKIFALGLTRQQELELRSLEGGSLAADIFHIIDPLSGSRESGLPIRIDRENKSRVRSLLSRGNIIFRKNGNALLSFDPVFARAGNWSDLLVAREYSADGTAVRNYQSSAFPRGADVASIQVDRDDNLIIQYVTIVLGRTGIPGVQTVHRGESAILCLPADGGRPLRAGLSVPAEEKMIGIRADGQIVTEIVGKGVIRIRQQ